MRKHTKTVIFTVLASALILTGACQQPLSDSNSGDPRAVYGAGTFRYAAPVLPQSPAIANNAQFYPATMDDTGILGAITAAKAAGGGHVVLSAGTYTINKRIALQSNISIEGAGRGVTILKRGPGFSYNTSSWTELLGAMDAVLHDVVIKNVSLDGDFGYSYLKNTRPLVYAVRISSSVDDTAHLNQRISFYNVEISNCSIGLNMGNSGDITVDACYIHNNGGPTAFENLYIRNVKNVLVKNSEFSFAYEGAGIKIAGGQNNYSGESKNVTIYNNLFRSNGWGNIGVSGMQNVRIYSNTSVYASYGSTATNNDAMVQGGIVLSYENGTANSGYNWNSNVDVVNNIVQDNNYAGIELTYTNGLNVQGNRCNGTSNGSNYNGPYSTTNVTCDYNTN